MLKKYFPLLVIIFIIGFAFAQENNSNLPLSPAENFSTANNSQTIEGDSSISFGVILRNITPVRFDVGDAQFALLIENIGKEAERNIVPLISGEGFSTFYIVPIEILKSGEKGYALINGNFKKAGNIALKIDLAGASYYFNVSVNNEKEIFNSENIKKEKQEILLELSKELELLKENYTLLENKIIEKKEQNYDISSVKLDEARKYIRAAETGILAEDASSARVNIIVKDNNILPDLLSSSICQKC
ncbi:MAG: hypothetical protein AABX65_02480 [Nanoarchaeota archaeon]